MASIVKNGHKRGKHEYKKGNIRTPTRNSGGVFWLFGVAGICYGGCDGSGYFGWEGIGVTNDKIGELIGLSYSAVSRLRRGERLPSVGVMVAISERLGWAVEDQVSVRVGQGAGAYSRRLNDYLDKLEDDTPEV